MRITQQMSTAATLAGLQTTANAQDNLQAQLSSGRQITKPSDNPSGTVTALQLRAQVAQATQYQANANSATSWLNSVDTTLGSVNNELQSARTLVVQGLNSGTSSTESNNALADQIDSIKASLLGLANQTYLGRPLFGGTTAGSVAFTAGPATAAVPSGITYSGDSGTITRDVAPATTVQINQTGTDVFGAAGNSVFDVLTTISNALRSGTLSSATAVPVGSATASASTTNPLAALDSVMALSTGQRSLEGAELNQVQTAQTTVTSNLLNDKTQLSSLQDIDIADMAVKVASANMAYQASLATTAKIGSVSLLDFLK